MTKLIFYLNGQFVPEDQAKVSILDLGFVRGYGVFDFLRTYNGKPFELDAHLKRLESSAKQIGLKLPKPLKELKSLMFETLKKNSLPDANIKIIVTGGISPSQLIPTGESTLAIVVYPLTIYPEENFTKGVKVITTNLGRLYPTAKTINYIPAIMALAEAKKKKAIEALYKNTQNEVLEGTTTNFFVFKKKTLITPKDKILGGISREVVLKIAQKKFKIELRPLPYSELKKVDEAFITNSSKEIMPVVKVDEIKIGNAKVGQNTKRLMELFKHVTMSP